MISWCVCVSACACVCVYPVSGAHGLVSGPGAGAEVELLDGETFVIETDVVRPTGRPILDVSQVGVSVDHHVRTAKQTQRLKRLQPIHRNAGMTHIVG